MGAFYFLIIISHLLLNVGFDFQYGFLMLDQIVPIGESSCLSMRVVHMVTLWVMHLATTEETKILMIKHEEDERINPKTRGKGVGNS